MSLICVLFLLVSSFNTLFSVLYSPPPPTCLLFMIISGLQTDEGLHLMEILARRAKIQMTDFAKLSYVFLLFIIRTPALNHRVPTPPCCVNAVCSHRVSSLD